jgi:hypothetical protein
VDTLNKWWCKNGAMTYSLLFVAARVQRSKYFSRFLLLRSLFKQSSRFDMDQDSIITDESVALTTQENLINPPPTFSFGIAAAPSAPSLTAFNFGSFGTGFRRPTLISNDARAGAYLCSIV